jgi:hypothetical protein
MRIDSTRQSRNDEAAESSYVSDTAGSVLMVEITGNYSLILPLLAACLAAYGVADFLRDRPVYEALLERDLLRAQGRPTLAGTLLLDFIVAPGRTGADSRLGAHGR